MKTKHRWLTNHDVNIAHTLLDSRLQKLVNQNLWQDIAPLRMVTPPVRQTF